MSSPILLPGGSGGIDTFIFLIRTYTRGGQFNVAGSRIDLTWRYRRTGSLERNICGSKVVNHIAYLY